MKVTFGSTVWWIRGQDAGQLAHLIVAKTFRFPHYTTVARDAVTAWHKGEVIYNTTDDKYQGYNGSDWVNLEETDVTLPDAEQFDLHEQVGTEMTAPAGSDRLVASDEGTSGDPNRWLSFTRLRTWMQGQLSLNAARITSGTIGRARIDSDIRTIRDGTADPNDSTGVDGDMYIKTSS